ncbi:DUF4129 domain-containing protein [Nesterenkonia alba]|uniref:DUF4129 domain-containing protein n=1 Tax=Nesterenkonia alba TaxID=515814 RepID=UPI0012EC9D60|nr:DUF4129 domain-containing protein [Nesterenkonia alba]
MRTTRAAWAVVLTTLGLLVLVWGSTAEVPRFTGDLPAPDIDWEPPEPEGDDPIEQDIQDCPTPAEIADGAEIPPACEDELPLADDGDLDDSNWLRQLIELGLILLGIAAAIILARTAVVVARRLRRWWAGRNADDAGPGQIVEDLAVAEAAAGRARERAVAEGQPRNAVVACWVALEDGAAQAGLTRAPSETAEEFTRRVLAHWDVDSATIAELAELYRTARFSRLPMTEDHRRRAIEALEATRRDIAAKQAAVTAERERAEAQRLDTQRLSAQHTEGAQ